MRTHQAFVYILSNKNHTVLYVGSTTNLEARVAEHRLGNGSRFTKSYSVYELLYYEAHSSISKAFRRERQMKKWRRAWKEELINEFNSGWKDLAKDWDHYPRV